jgi:RecJ-like exonuclease
VKEDFIICPYCDSKGYVIEDNKSIQCIVCEGKGIIITTSSQKDYEEIQPVD